MWLITVRMLLKEKILKYRIKRTQIGRLTKAVVLLIANVTKLAVLMLRIFHSCCSHDLVNTNISYRLNIRQDSKIVSIASDA